MTRNREFPDSWPPSKYSKPSQIDGWQHPTSASAASSRPLVPPTSGGLPRDLPLEPLGQPEPQQSPTPKPSPSKRRRKPPGGIPRSFQFWAAVIVLVFGGVGFSAVALLLKLPAVPNCPKTFWPTASASMRLYCAQVAANKQTAGDLLEAIALVEGLPKDHPLRPEIDRSIEAWSLDVLKIGEEKFQAGQLDDAIEIARRIPAGVAAYGLVEKQVERWQTIWSKAQGIFKNAEQELRDSDWNQAFREAVKLTTVGNRYWATAQYERLVDLIQLGREASAKLDKAFKLSQSGRVDDLFAAIKEAETIAKESFAYKESRDMIAKWGNKLVEIAQERLERSNWQGALEIANKLPASVKLPEVKADLIDLANAVSKAEGGTVSGIEEAIAIAQRLTPERPLYDKGRQLVDRWQKETADLARLERARTLASSGLPADLRTAVAEAQQIPSNNPRYQEARAEMGRWVRQAETIEDRPVLDRAEQIASFGDVASLQEAVQEASRISAGRALYREAQAKIGEWTGSIQRVQDQPYLDQARALADSGNLPAAISAAGQIQPGRALYDEAQRNVRTWQADIEGQQRLQEAYDLANATTPDALTSAIQVARRVPTASKYRGDARTAVNRWAYQILEMAQDRSSYNIAEAIAIAKMVPSGTEAYAIAQEQIDSWQQTLAPPPVPTYEEPTGTDAGLF